MTDSVVVAKIGVKLPGGSIHVWMLPMERTNNGLGFRALAFLPEGAQINDVEYLTLPVSKAQVIIADYTQVSAVPE